MTSLKLFELFVGLKIFRIVAAIVNCHSLVMIDTAHGPPQPAFLLFLGLLLDQILIELLIGWQVFALLDLLVDLFTLVEHLAALSRHSLLLCYWTEDLDVHLVRLAALLQSIHVLDLILHFVFSHILFLQLQSALGLEVLLNFSRDFDGRLVQILAT